MSDLTRVAESQGVGGFSAESDFSSDSGSPIGSFFYITLLAKSGIPVEMVQFLLKLLVKQRILAVYHGFRWMLVAAKLWTVKLHSCYAKESEILKSSESDILPPTPQLSRSKLGIEPPTFCADVLIAFGLTNALAHLKERNTSCSLILVFILSGIGLFSMAIPSGDSHVTSMVGHPWPQQHIGNNLDFAISLLVQISMLASATLKEVATSRANEVVTSAYTFVYDAFTRSNNGYDSENVTVKTPDQIKLLLCWNIFREKNKYFVLFLAARRTSQYKYCRIQIADSCLRTVCGQSHESNSVLLLPSNEVLPRNGKGNGD